jgi:hypothetical protein
MNISFCTVVLSLIQGIALNTGVLPLAKGGALQFVFMGGIYMAHDTQYMFKRHDQKLVIFTFLSRFHELLPTVLGF